ncbi:phosphatase PAP2 family protein [Gryllotalpicola ginsengisoli]|uniref:phosphatase PAP2 family protein n=1 Tax=Gryllotalpicola ginsengisoli TaxID=444608 RepID=UPI0003B51C3A|nr:phosphatase PAP2 family protein [Gryllotalpicola ginsengisoli]
MVAGVGADRTRGVTSAARLEPADDRTAAWRVAAISAGSLVAAYAFLVLTPAGQVFDADTLGEIRELGVRADRVLNMVRELLLVGLIAYVAVLVVVALWQRRVRVAVTAVLMVVVTAALSTAAKGLLPRPAYEVAGYPWNTFPSDHMAATVSLLVAANWLLPGSLPARARTVSLAVTGLVSGWAQVATHAHRQSDVIGATLLAATVAAVAAATTGRKVVGSRRTLTLAPWTATVGLLVLLVWRTLGWPAGTWWAGIAGAELLVLAPLLLALGLRPGSRRPPRA